MNPQHIHQNMGYLPLLAEEGLKVVNSFQGSVPMAPDNYHHPQSSGQQAPYIPQHYHMPDQGYHPQERMQGMYSMAPGTSSSAVEEMGMHGFLDNRAPQGVGPFTQAQYLPKSAAVPAPVEPKPKEKTQKPKKNKGGRPKKRNRDPKSWKRNQSKYLRNSGQPYINSNGCLMPARQLKDPCKNCRQRCTERITEEEREQVFNSYWDPSKDWTYRRLYVIDHAIPQPIQRRRSKDLDKKARRISFHYYLTVDGEQEKVCKKFFLNTLGVGEKFVIISLHKKTVDGQVIPDRRGRHPAANQIPFTVKQEARRHIQSILANTPQEQVSLPKMYEAYCQQCEMQQQDPVKKHFYRKLMNEELRINQQRLDGPNAVRNEDRPLDYTPTPQVSALECLIKELWQKEQERRSMVKEKINHKEKLKEYHALRYAGKEYINFRGQVRPSRKMKPPCENCQKGCTERITESQRQELFNQFWDADKDWTEKRKYVLSCTESHPVLNTRLRGRLSSRAVKRIRSLRFTYAFEIDGKKIPVCRHFFVNTLGLSHSFVASCTAKKDENGELAAGKKNKYGTLAKLPPVLSKEIRQHIIYKCWADPNKAREYQTHSSTKGWSWNVSKMYESYRQCCWNRGSKPASTYMYRRVFSEEMRIFHEMEAEVPSTPSTSTRGSARKDGEMEAAARGERAIKEKPTPPIALSQPSKNVPVSPTNCDNNDSDEESENEFEPEEESDEYVPSSEEEDNQVSSEDEEEPPRKKKQTQVVPECSDTVPAEETSQPRKPTRLSEQHVSFSQPSVSVEEKKARRRRQWWDTADMRCAGQSYINDKGMVIPARKIKEPCKNCRKQCLEKVPQEMREKIFNMFWSKEMTWEKKRQYMEDCIEENAVKKRTLPPSEMKLNRKCSMKYTLRLGNWEQNVCKLFFVNTLGISQKFAIVSMRKKKERQLKEMGMETCTMQLPHIPTPETVSPEHISQGHMAQGQMPDPSSLDPNSDNSLRDVLSHLLLTPANSMQQV